MTDAEFARRVARLLISIEFASSEPEYDCNYADEPEFVDYVDKCPACGCEFPLHGGECDLAVVLREACRRMEANGEDDYKHGL